MRKKTTLLPLFISILLSLGGCITEHGINIQEIKIDNSTLRDLVSEERAYYYKIKFCHNACTPDTVNRSTWEQTYEISKDGKRIIPLKRAKPDKLLDSAKLVHNGFIGWEEKGNHTSGEGYFQRTESQHSNSTNQILTVNNGLAFHADFSSIASRNGQYFGLLNYNKPSKNHQWHLFKMNGSANLMKSFDRAELRDNNCSKARKQSSKASLSLFLNNNGKEIAILQDNDQLGIYSINDKVVECYASGFERENIKLIDIAWLDSGIIALGYNTREREYYLVNFLTNTYTSIDSPYQTEYTIVNWRGWDPVNHLLFLSQGYTRDKLVKSIVIYDYKNQREQAFTITK